MSYPISALQLPSVGSELNWQGHAQLQLQLPTSSPLIRHAVFPFDAIGLTPELSCATTQPYAGSPPGVNTRNR
jgi:hypothetical protein